MNIEIANASMNRDDEGAYLGRTVFRAEGHKADYEITFYSKRGKEWDYSLNFASESGDEDQMLQLDAAIEEDDALFDSLLDAALESATAE